MLGMRLADSNHICEWLFADDLRVFIPAIEQAFSDLEEVISLYERASGEKLNLPKSSVIPMGLPQIPNWVIAKNCQILNFGGILKYLDGPLGSNIPS